MIILSPPFTLFFLKQIFKHIKKVMLWCVRHVDFCIWFLIRDGTTFPMWISFLWVGQYVYSFFNFGSFSYSFGLDFTSVLCFLVRNRAFMGVNKRIYRGIQKDTTKSPQQTTKADFNLKIRN